MRQLPDASSGKCFRTCAGSPKPSMVKEKFDHLFGLMDEYGRGEEAPFTPALAYGIPQVGAGPSLSDCTFYVPA